MSAVLDLTAGNAALRELYGVDDFNTVLTGFWQKYPLMAMFEKIENAGKSTPVVLATPGAGASADFATAQANSVAPEYERFTVLGYSLFETFNLSGDAIASSSTESGSFVDFIKDGVDKKIRGLTSRVSEVMWGDGTGCLNPGGCSAISTGLVTLTNKGDIVGFKKGMKVCDSGTVTGALDPTPYFVISVNYAAGTLHLSATQGGATATGPSATTYPYFFPAGDNDAVAMGITGYLPSSAPSVAESFLGLDRSSNSYYYGAIIDSSGKSLEEALIDGSMTQEALGGMLDMNLVNPIDFGSLLKSLSSKALYDLKDSEGRISFKALMLATPSGVIPIIGDRNCPQGNAFQFQMDTWKLQAHGKLVDIIRQPSGLEFVPLANSDGAELRLCSRLFAVCNRMPGFNSRLVSFGS